jgi:protein O-mannosyl-transferase
MVRTRRRGCGATTKAEHRRDRAIGDAQSKARRTFWALGLIGITVLAYAPVLRYPFVNYDDPQYVTANPQVIAGLTWRGVGWALTAGRASNWHPVTWWSHMLDVELYGLNAGPHHSTNLLLHIASTLLLFGLLHRTTGMIGRSGFAAALFAVHPLHVESVAWVAERKDVLSTLFFMLTLSAYAAYTRQPRRDRYLAVLGLFTLGVMAKPMLVTLPFVLLLLDVWPLGRMPFPFDRTRLGALLYEKLWLFALALASALVTFLVQQRGGAVAELDAIPWSHRAANATVSYVTYISKALWPTGLAVLYPYRWSLSGWLVVTSGIVLVGCTAAAIRAARHYPYVLVGWLWYVGTLVPVIGLIQVGNQAMADRYTYLPLVGLFIVVAWAIPDLVERTRRRAALLWIAGGLTVLACALGTRAQVQHWRSSIALWSRALDVTTDNYLAHHNLGVALADEGRTTDAISHYEAALRIEPGFTNARKHLGFALLSEGKSDEAGREFREVLRVAPDAEAYFNLASALKQQGRRAEAIAEYTEALRIEPGYVEAHGNLGMMLAEEGRNAEAIEHCLEALRLRPGFAPAHTALGLAYSNQAKIDEALREFFEAARLMPDPQTLNNLGVILTKQGRNTEALAQFAEAVHLNPDYADGHRNLGLTLEEEGRVDEAVREFAEALRVNPDDQVARRMLDYLTKQIGR